MEIITPGIPGDFMLSQIVNILDSTIKAYKNVKAFIVREYHIHRSRKIRKAVDNRNADDIEHIVRDVVKRRADRADSN